jgi:dTDP-4-amino-4,6-dideoxygalactose transaminase
VIRLTRPSIDDADLAAVHEVVASGQLVQGPRVAEFERALAEFVGAKHAVALTNCTAALQMALLALDVRPGDIVLVGAYSWPATANVVELCGARPEFVDIDPVTFNMRPDALDELLSRLTRTAETARRIKAIIPVHTFGQIADMTRINEVASRFGVPVVEDAACALGASMNGRQAGTLGVMGCFSFHPRKAITTGEGGMITTEDDTIARYLRALRNHGLDPDAPSPDFMLPGFNNRMTEFQAALGVTQMEKVDRIVAARRSLAAVYDGLLDPDFERGGARGNDERHVFQSYVVLLPVEVAAHRADFIVELRARGVEAQIGTWHMPLIKYYRTRYGYKPGDFPVCDDVSARALTLPLYEGLTRDEQETVARQVREVCLGSRVDVASDRHSLSTTV